MAFLVLRRVCKWETRPSDINLSKCFSHSLPVRRDEQNEAIEIVNLMLKVNKYGYFDHIESLWVSFFATPYKWHDYRMKKKIQRAPDFKHIESGHVLWIGSPTTPDWVKSKLDSLGGKGFAASPSVEQVWRSLFFDPSKWVDHRIVKKGDGHPDFVHKYTCETLWIKRDQVPSWVSPMLKSLPDERFASFPNKVDLWRDLFANTSKWFDYRKTKKSIMYPDFIHKVTCDALWVVDERNPTCVTSMLNNIQDEAFASFPSIENQWKNLFANPSNWRDYRRIKKNKKFPDFKHKENGAALWIYNGGTPSWVLPMLNGLPVDAFESSSSLEDLWISFFLNQSKWIDYREIKKNNLPDFVHKDTTEALWIKDVETLTWVTSMLNNLQSEAFAPFPTKENAWISLLNNPSKWLNYRENKKTPNFPDFVHKENGEALWIDSKNTPNWVIPKLNGLQYEAFASSGLVEDLWISFFADRSKWLDYRKTKKSDKHPDFVRKDTTEVLWIESAETPAWATLMLNNLQTEGFAPSTSTENLWKDLFADPSKWLDNRSTKLSIKYPDFKHKNTGEGLWLDDKRTPSWVAPQLEELCHETFAGRDEILASHDLKWKAFFACPSIWFDNRTRKITQNTPDFRHKKTKEVLWIARSGTPDWVVPGLEKLEKEAFTTSKVEDWE